MTSEQLTNEQKEACAIAGMRSMLEDYSAEQGIPFEEAFSQFAISPIYNALFDYSTGLWREGPDYLREIYNDVKSKN